MGKLLIILGAIIVAISGYFFWEMYAPQRLAFDIKNYKGVTSNPSVSRPVGIIIPAVKIKLPIFPATLKNGNWESTTKGVSYLSSSPIPGQKGNSILYGHDWYNLLGKIVGLKPGQIIEITYADHSTKKFIISSTVRVSPTEVSILAPSKTPQITLYTCTGFLDSQRFVVVAKPENT